MITIARSTVMAGVAVLCAIACAGGTSVAQEPSLLALEATARLPLEGERKLVIEGLPGKVGVRIGKPGEIRFVSVAQDDRDVEVPLEVWQDGRTIRVRLPPDSTADPIRFEATVPPGVGVEITDCGPEVSVANVEGDVVVAGSGIGLQAVGIAGAIRLELVDATVRLDVTGDELDLDFTRVEGTVTRSNGGAVVRVRESRIEFGGLGGDLELEADRSEVVVGQVRGQVRVTARGGKIELDTVDGGARLRLEEAPLALKAVKGDVEIDTNRDVRFENCAADLHVNSYGGSVRGVGNEGLVEVKTDGASIAIENVNGPVRVEGDSLQVQLKQISGEVWVFTTSSELVLDNLSASVRIEIEYGDVTASRVTGKLDVSSRDGNVRVSAQTGPVVVSADGDEVEVGWVSMAWSEDSRIENERGDVTVMLPKQGGCTLSAEAKYGGVESEIEDIEVSGDGTSASGVIRRQSRPRLDIVAAGVIRILPATGGDAAAEGESGGPAVSQ